MKPRNCMECEHSHITIQNGYCQCKLTGNCYIPIIMTDKISDDCPLYKEEIMDNKLDFINGITRKLVNNEQLTPMETQAVISALRESHNCLQKPYYEVIYHDEYDNTEHRIMEPVYSRIIDAIPDDCKIQEDCFHLKFRRIIKEESEE